MIRVSSREYWRLLRRQSVKKTDIIWMLWPAYSRVSDFTGRSIRGKKADIALGTLYTFVMCLYILACPLVLVLLVSGGYFTETQTSQLEKIAVPLFIVTTMIATGLVAAVNISGIAWSLGRLSSTRS